MAADGALETLVVHLRGMRVGLQLFETGDRSTWPDARERRSVLLDRYDLGLVRAAETLGLPVPPPPPLTPEGRRRLSDGDRTHLEDVLRAAGIDL